MLFAKPAGWPLKRILLHSFLRSNSATPLPQHITLRIMSTTGNAIKSYCQSHGLSHKAVAINCGKGQPDATLHFVGCSPGDPGPVYLYFHGGGYINPMIGTAHPPFTMMCAEAAGVRNVIFLEYVLAPELKYPGQLVQAVAALNFVLETTNPQDIIIGGESAGGNLALALIAHIKYPKAGVLRVSSLKAALRGALLLSPWVSAEYMAASYTRNARNDYLTSKTMAICNNAWEPLVHDVWAAPLAGDDHFWSKVPVDRVLLTAGTLECFHDDILAMAKKMNAVPMGSAGPVQLALADNEVHAQCVADAMLHYTNGRMTRDVLQWMSSSRA